MKTIKMSKDNLARWLKGLRDGSFKQGSNVLEDVTRTYGGVIKNYCCLGVLQMVVAGDVQRGNMGGSMSFPTKAWLKEHNIEFKDCDGNPDNDPYLSTLRQRASCANDAMTLDDGHLYDFAAIADAIEAAAEVTP